MSAAGWNRIADGTSGQSAAAAHDGRRREARPRQQVKRHDRRRAGQEREEPGQRERGAVGGRHRVVLRRRPGTPASTASGTWSRHEPRGAGRALHRRSRTASETIRPGRVGADVEGVLAVNPVGIIGEESPGVADLVLRDHEISARPLLVEGHDPLRQPVAGRRTRVRDRLDGDRRRRSSATTAIASRPGVARAPAPPSPAPANSGERRDAQSRPGSRRSADGPPGA